MPSHERYAEAFHYSLRQEINELYWVIAIRNFAVQMPGFFVPIFIFQLFNGSLPATFLFYAIQTSIQVLLVPLSAKLLGTLGVKKMMTLGSPFIGVYFIMLLLAKEFGLIFIILALLTKGFYLATYWPARHVDFARFAHEQKRSRQIGTGDIIKILIHSIAPLVGGLIIVHFGFGPLFVLSTVLLLGATLPLFRSREVYETYSLSWLETFKRAFARKDIRTSLAFFFEGIEYSTSIFLFPIFIFLIIGSYDTIGWITSASLAIAIVATYLVGRASDRHGSKKIISFSSIAHGFAWIFMSFIATPLQYFIYAGFFRIAETANHLPFISYFYKQAREQGHGIDEYIVRREIQHNLGRVAVFLLIALAFSLGVGSFFAFFVLAGISAFLMRIIK